MCSNSDEASQICSISEESTRGPACKRSDSNAEPSQEQDEYSFSLCAIQTFESEVLMNIRECYEQDGYWKPGKEGISFSTDRWKKLEHQIGGTDNAITLL
uniref:AlNc14C121G6666 protein n=1 Tax=Albugo laibachii Nc14 TaxID=890382 RepID=F0WJD8_9STRA|nr:AlNc14C121G6666 [Albugo laibachii Nc14]|eukprot:CCA21386.1 AlNc14C121G6666 [Albugo laibachii Nc14]